MTWPVDCSLLLRGACYTVGHVGLPNAGYQGSEEYRAFGEWWAVVHSDLDPRVNGTNYKHGRGCNHTNAESDACTSRCHPFVFPQLPPPTGFPGVQVPSLATNVYERGRLLALVSIYSHLQAAHVDPTQGLSSRLKLASSHCSQAVLRQSWISWSLVLEISPSSRQSRSFSVKRSLPRQAQLSRL
jgi:hypothetical protein